MKVQTVTWDSVNKGTGVTLSNNNLTSVIPNYNNTVRASHGKTSGKWYWEVSFSNMGNGGALVGIVKRDANLNSLLAATDNVRMYYNLGEKTFPRLSYGTAYTAVDVIGIALDMDIGAIEFYKNGISQGVAYTDIKNMGEVFPSVTSWSSASGNTNTVNFGATSFKYAIPNGYLPYNIFYLNKILLLSNEKNYSFEVTQESHILNMTSNTSPSPYVVTASHTRSSAYAPWKVFNGTNASESDSWHTSTAVGDKWIQIDFGSARRVNEVHVTSINHSTATSRSPRSFSVLGSNDDVNFDTLFQTENDITSWNIYETMTFYFNNEKKYRFYRFLVKKTIEDISSFDLRLGQLLYSYQGKKVIEIPNSSVSNFIEYGVNSPVKFDGTFFIKNYILQDTLSEDENGLLTTQINRKPLSIKFDK